MTEVVIEPTGTLQGGARFHPTTKARGFSRSHYDKVNYDFKDIHIEPRKIQLFILIKMAAIFNSELLHLLGRCA